MIVQRVVAFSVIFSVLFRNTFADNPCRFEVAGKGVIDLTSVGRDDGQPLYENLAPLIESNYSRLLSLKI